ncbi:MAG: cheW3 [Symbiobacteriaceae bacterium]|jgi:purine-binding chemotaxis protein CheW|nr:cheW3 [Symbiobacteriaceae bacterium]
MMAQQEQREQITQLVVFQLGHELYGADISVVREVSPVQRVTKVPRTPKYIEGVTNLRGRVIPVVDLRRRLGLPVSSNTKSTRIAVAELEGGQVGMIVDAVLEVLRVPQSSIEPPSQLLSKIDAEYVTGVAKMDGRLIILLDLARVLQREERKVV